MPQDIVLLTAIAMLITNGAGLWVSLRVAGAKSDNSTGQPLTDRKTLVSRLPLIVGNLVVLTSISLFALHHFREIFHWETPLWHVAALQLLWISFADDFVFYFYHRFLHLNRFAYKHIHRIHHRAHAPVPIEYIYVHPLEWVGGSSGPVLGFLALYLLHGELSAWVFLAYSIYRPVHELSIHSGRKSRLRARIGAFATPQHHGFHHSRPNDGNYAATYVLWDRLLGTEVTEETPHAQSG